MEMSPDGSFVVILKNNNVELRSSKEDFNHINFHYQVYRDMYPQWRCIAWSNFSNYFGVTFSNGMCNIWDTHGSRLVLKYAKSNEYDPVIKLILVNLGKSKLKCCICTLKRRFLIYIIQNLKVLSSYETDINFISTPILCMEISVIENILLFGTYGQSSNNEACKSGLISCQLTEEMPFTVRNLMKKDCIDYKQKSSWIPYLFSKRSMNAIYSIQISKDNRKLAALHLSGELSVWLFPSLTLHFRWLPNSSFTNDIVQKPQVVPGNTYYYSTIDICWWNDDYVVIALENGRIVILNTDQSEKGKINLLPFPQIQSSIDKSFFSLSCCVKSSSTPGASNQVIKSDDQSNQWLSWKSVIKLVSYFFQDDSSMMFANKVEMCSLNIQMSQFKLTTPPELFQIHIDKKQYVQALALAQQHDLDIDIVFQKQWRDSEKSIADIENILIKIQKRNWILNECLERIPNSINSLKCLLSLGLFLTQENQPVDLDIVSIKAIIDKPFFQRQESLNLADSTDLSLSQIERVRIRLKLLSYCDKLSMYEEIIDKSACQFHRERFEELKNLSPFELSIAFANSAAIIDLQVLMDRYQSSLGVHVLTILSNIPECVQPKCYQNMFDFLPILKRETDSLSTEPILDWCESARYLTISNEILSDNEKKKIYYETHPDHSSLILTSDLDKCQSIFTGWLNKRIRDIERMTLNAGFALELVDIARHLQVSVDRTLEFNLRFLCEAIYNCQISNTFLHLEQFQSMSLLDQAKLLVSKTDANHFLTHFIRWIIPFSKEIHSQSTENVSKFYREYLLDLGSNSLVCVRKLLEDKSCVDSIGTMIDIRDFVSVCLDILYNHDDDGQSGDQMSNFNESTKIARLLNGIMSQQPDRYISEVKQLQDIDNYISVQKMMQKYDLHKSLKFIHTNRMNGDLVENLITTMVHRYLIKQSKIINRSIIRSVFTEIQVAMCTVFKSIHPKLIYKNLLKSLLESGDRKKIDLACEFMDLTSKLTPINDLESQEKLLDFVETVDCVAKSARNYIDSSTSSRDNNFRLAKYCLGLIRDHSDQISKELDLVKCCEFVDKYHCSIVPIEVRSIENRFELLKKCLDTNRNLYKNLEEIVDAGRFLCSEKILDKKFREGEALRLVAEKALANMDWEILEIVMKSLMHRNHKPSWKECILCLKQADFTIDQKMELGKYAISCCPKSTLLDCIKIIKEIETSVVRFAEPQTQSVDNSNTSTNSHLIKQPIKFISSGLTDISSKLSLKSLIDKSSDTIVKISNQVSQFSSGTSQDLYKILPDQVLTKSVFHLIYQSKGSFSLETKTDSLIKLLNESLHVSTTQKQPEIDQIHLKLVKYNLNRDTFLSIIHSIFINNLQLIHNFRHDFSANLFNRGLVLSMIKFNLIFKYSPGVSMRTILKTGLDEFLTPLLSKLTESQLSILKSMNQEYQDYLILQKISAILPNISRLKFFGFVDYQKETVLKLSGILEPIEAFRYSLALCDRYGFDRKNVLKNYFRVFIEKVSSADSDDEFKRAFDQFQSVFDWSDLLTDLSQFRNDLESMLITCQGDREFRVILKVMNLVDTDFVLFNRTVKQHLNWIDLFYSIYNYTDRCSYIDFFNGSNELITSALKHVINIDNSDSCARLMNEFQMGAEFDKIKQDFIVVLANQSLWNTKRSVSESSDFIDLFSKSLANFSINDHDHYKDFISSILFDRSNRYVDLQLKINVLKLAASYVEEKIMSEFIESDNNVTNWSKVTMEIEIWLDHIEQSVMKVIGQLKSLPNISSDIIQIAEYLPPENYWDCLMNEMLLSGIPYQDFFTFTWNLSIDSFIIEEAVGNHILYISQSKFIPTEAILEKVSQIFDELDEYLDSLSIENVISSILTQSKQESHAPVVHWLLNEMIYRTRFNKSTLNIDIQEHIFFIISQWQLPIITKFEINSVSNLFIIEALVQHCDSPSQMIQIAKVVELIELIHEDNRLWQLWVKNCIIKGPDHVATVFDQFTCLKTNKLYKDRFPILIKEAVQSLCAFNSSDAIALLILKDPVKSLDQIQDILTNLKSDPIEYTNTMKNINKASLQILVDQKLIPLYAKTILFQRLVNYITKEHGDPNLINDVVEQLKQNGLRDEATWLATSSAHINPAMKTIEMVSGFWKRFSTGGSS